MPAPVDRDDEAATAPLQVIICRLAGQDYGIRITAVREIIRLEAASHLPDSPSFVEGVIDFRGETVLVIDLRKFLGLAAPEHSADSRTIILDLADRTTGLIVDAVTEVATIGAEDIDDGRSTGVISQGSHLAGVARGVGDRMIILLQVEEIVAGIDGTASAVAS